MALIEETLTGTINKVEIAINRLKSFEPPDGYFLAFSGGKDSQCIYHLAERIYSSWMYWLSVAGKEGYAPGL